MSVSYTLRLPDDLKRLLDSEAQRSGKSTAQLVVDACWASVDGRVEPKAAPVAKQDRADLSATIAVNLPPDDVVRNVEMCTYKEYDSDLGEWYGCRLPAHSPKVKHQRGPRH